MFGQHKYVKRQLHQIEILYKEFNFSWLQESRIGCCVCHSPWTRGERMTAQVKNIEIWNSFFAWFPMVKSWCLFFNREYMLDWLVDVWIPLTWIVEWRQRMSPMSMAMVKVLSLLWFPRSSLFLKYLFCARYLYNLISENSWLAS